MAWGQGSRRQSCRKDVWGMKLWCVTCWPRGARPSAGGMDTSGGFGLRDLQIPKSHLKELIKV